MTGLELGARYRTGRGGARVVFRDGSTVQLEPYASIKFASQPLKVEGRLVRVTRRGTTMHEAPAREAPEVKE